jgi:hypothetical protein
MADNHREDTADPLLVFSRSDYDEESGVVEVNDSTHEGDGADASGESLGSWHIVRSGVAVAASAMQRPLQFFIGDDSHEGLVETMQAQITITAPKWALVSILGLGIAVLWQQERRIRATQAMFENHSESLLRLAKVLVANSHRTAEIQAVASETVMQSHRESSLLMCGMAATALLLLSDQRLKTDLRRLPLAISGCQLYSWKWSEEAKARFGLSGIAQGVIAQDVARLHPYAARVGLDGYMRVNYGLLLSNV